MQKILSSEIITDESLNDVYIKLPYDLQKQMALECNSVPQPITGNIVICLVSQASYQIELRKIQEKYRLLI